MSISKRDLEELKRFATNTYDDDKRLMQRVIYGISKMEAEITQLTAEVKRLTVDPREV